MYKKNLTLIAAFTLLSTLVLGSCSEEQGIDNPPPSGTTAIAIAIESKASLPDEMTCEMYIFHQEETGTYTLADRLDLGPTGQQTLELENEYLKESDAYRFLFVATHTDHAEEIEIKNAEGGPLQVGDQWEGILLEAVTQNLSGDFYYEVKDKTGTEIYADKKVSAELIRLAGQPVIDIFKTEEMDISQPVDKLDSIGSVLDWVFQIDIEYTGLTKSVRFEGTELVEVEKWDGPYLQTIKPEVVSTAGSELYKVYLPQADKGLVTSGAGTEGSVRILGPAALPIASQTLRMKATFHYYLIGYSKCPTHDFSTHEHSMDCQFTYSILELNLPATNAPEGFNILSNTYTANKAGLPFDRVIDVSATSESFHFYFYWQDGQPR